MGAFPASRSPMQPRIAEGIHDPLYVQALALSDDTTTIVICSADLLSFQWIDVDAMRNAFAAQSDLPPENLILFAPTITRSRKHLFFGGATKMMRLFT